jgi:hypothetical protein
MAEYYFLLDAATFEQTMRPALAASWRQRSFEPCRALCEVLLPPARSYAERYHTGEDEPLLARALRGLSFDRQTWRTLVSETLLFGALDIPEFQVCSETLCCILAPEHYRAGVQERDRLAPIQQAHLGARDVTFGAAIYRPEFAGFNAAADVRRLAGYLESVRPESWTAADLAALPDVADEDRADEIEFAREWFPALVEMYRRAALNNWVIVHESIF